MNKENMTVLSNIIAAVESGGQVYGNKDYSCYVPPFANSDVEYTITLGWAQNFGNEAQVLIGMIFDADRDAARAIDTGGRIEAALIGFNWVNECWNPNEQEKQTLIRLISSDAGRKCQDELFGKLMQTFVEECETKYTTDVGAVMMYCEIRHLGGRGPAERIFDRLNGDYSLDNIMASLVKDQRDKSNDNQVGDTKFWVRHLKCKEFIERYAVPETSDNKVEINAPAPAQVRPAGTCTVKEILDIMRAWLGLSRAAGTHRLIIDLYNSYRPLARGYAVQYEDAYCATTVSAAFIKAGAVALIGGTECGVEEFIKIFKNKGIWIEDGNAVPKVGDIICYNWDTSYQPNDGYADHIGIVERVDTTSRTMTVIEGNINGMVGRRTIAFGWGYIRGFARPDYWTDESSTDTGTTVSTPPAKASITVEEAAQNTIAGKYGNGDARKKQIEALGLSYDEVQARVNAILLGSDTTVTSQTADVAPARSHMAQLAGAYRVTASSLNCRYKPGVLSDDNIITRIQNGELVQCYGYYTEIGRDLWLLVEYKNVTGYVSSKYLSKL